MAGARSKAAIDREFMMLLEAGSAESRTHIEQMSMKMSRLLFATFPEVVVDADALDNVPFIARLRTIGALLRSTYGSEVPSGPWVSDTVRGWLAMATASDDSLSLDDLVLRLMPYAHDHHFAVREWAWLAIRPRVVANPLAALASLKPASGSSNPLERRFAVEATRPRSVWGGHVPLFKEQPEVAGPFLDALQCEPDPYVRRSVGNWLRDAGRTRPDWTAEVTDGWCRQCSCKSTAWIARRARVGLPSSFELRLPLE
jgi:3-methyladenine DNA glycosylase AlkC